MCQTQREREVICFRKVFVYFCLSLSVNAAFTGTLCQPVKQGGKRDSYKSHRHVFLFVSVSALTHSLKKRRQDNLETGKHTK